MIVTGPPGPSDKKSRRAGTRRERTPKQSRKRTLPSYYIAGKDKIKEEI